MMEPPPAHDMSDLAGAVLAQLRADDGADDALPLVSVFVETPSGTGIDGGGAMLLRVRVNVCP
jgi:hypothetical protein